MTDTVLVDMGNTRLKWVIARSGTILEGTLGRGGAAGFFSAFEALAVKPGQLLLSSVAGKTAADEFVGQCETRLDLKVTRLKAEKECAGIVSGYMDPTALGVDRWLAIIGAAHCHGMPVVVMDLGTATTLDAVDGQGRHLGGLILPGPALMLESLAGATAMQVPDRFKSAVEFPGQVRNPGVAPARSTSSAIQEGVFAAQIGALDQFIRNVSMELGTEPKLVLTGGAAEGILGRLEKAPVFDPWLVFKGMLQHQG
jgi:type III pantothenate kinase